MKTRVLICLLFSAFGATTVSGQEAPQNRKPCVAGRFYPGNADELKATLKQLFSAAVQGKSGDQPLALIVPHAGYVFSGEVAASAYRQIDPEQKFERIFIIGSSHTTAFQGASIYCKGDYETPLGTVKVDTELAQKLIDDNKLIRFHPEAHRTEHSIEVQLPFLQYYLKNDFRIVPIIIGSSNIETAKNLASVLKPYLNEKNLFVISSDFSHYPSYSDAVATDRLTAEAIRSNQPSTLIDVLDRNRKKGIPGLSTSLCGWSSALALLYITEQFQEIKANLVQYKNSGDSRYGDKERVVGYWAISFSKETKTGANQEFSLSENDKKYLLELARETITEFIGKGTVPTVNTSPLSSVLKTPCGAFVTLHKNQRLRGCIGRFDPGLPLYEVVQSMAIAAATQDHRFERVQFSEIDQLEIEISVLTPMKRIRSADEFVLGKHGIYIRKGNASGTFLPQVATDTGWSKEEFLGHCARDKAGIGWDGWKTAELYTYEALVFGEE
ncbi:MAG: AmmeMemoRadiSam system protein B [Prolixibacteraceae bacterium]|jgi:AmmeMemoRadiSam system protein B/AmmeMemoRadiSam system protein A|nr:AmmeMemoRadiSam system protein B [Prolixibacteraceae bacterium]